VGLASAWQCDRVFISWAERRVAAARQGGVTGCSVLWDLAARRLSYTAKADFEARRPPVSAETDFEAGRHNVSTKTVTVVGFQLPYETRRLNGSRNRGGHIEGTSHGD
jgi:hypothetical protein